MLNNCKNADSGLSGQAGSVGRLAFSRGPQGWKKARPRRKYIGQFLRSTFLDMGSRLRVARGIAKAEIQASLEVFQALKRRGHPDGPPPIVSDGWGGIAEAMIAVHI
jgi:hypothetical protein